LSAHTHATLYTGGKGQVNRQALIGLSGGASEYGWPTLIDGFWPHNLAWGGTEGYPISGNKIKVGGMALASDYQVWIASADNATMGVTVEVPGVRH
jgi:hypothetical protein